MFSAYRVGFHILPLEQCLTKQVLSELVILFQRLFQILQASGNVFCDRLPFQIQLAQGVLGRIMTGLRSFGQMLHRLLHIVLLEVLV